MTESKFNNKKIKGEDTGSTSLEKHLLIDDSNIGAMSRIMKIKVGAYLGNLMCKNLKYKVG